MIRRVGVLLGAVLAAIGLVAWPADASPRSLSECSAAFYQDDARLGPLTLPVTGAVGVQLIGYQRTGFQSPQRFLATFYDPATSSWRYPPLNGYVLGADGRPIEFTSTLFAGQQIDRYGSEYGGFLAPVGLPYAMRSIPPSSLDGTPAAGCNYHVYLVNRSFAVDAGPIAPWFGQPGGGLQYQLDGDLVPGAPAQLNVLWLLDNGYLTRLR